MRLAVLDHHGKAQYLAYRLMQAGFDLVPDAARFDYELMLVDTDSPHAAPMPQKHNLVKEAVKRGIPVVLYPHGGGPILDYDGIRKFAVPVSLQLVHGEGDAEIYRRCGLSHRYEVVGWTFCPQVDSSGGPVDHLVFAPIHPWANGRDILPVIRSLNHNAYRHFLEHPAPQKTVRMFGEDSPNGVHQRVEGVEYTQSNLLTPIELIDMCDAVVSSATFAYTALARGKRAAFIYGYPGHTSDDGQVQAAHIEEYADYVKYPACIGEAPLEELLEWDVSEWKRLFVGEELDIDKVSELLRGLRPNRATRRALARA